MPFNSSHIILDACCILNFCASGHFLQITQAIPVQVIITQIVLEQELINFERFYEKDKHQFNESITTGIIKIVDFEFEEETDLFVNYLDRLDDGEAATGAIAIYRGWSIATDDKAAINLFRQENPNLEILSTPEILKYWSEKEKLSPLELKNVIKSIRVNGKYAPPKNHPLRNWWEGAG